MKGGGGALLAAAALFLLLVIAAAAAAGDDATDFCSRVEVRRGCPTLPTAATNGIDADALLGAWFEIGGTARYKRGGGAGRGGVCTRANLTAGGGRGALQIWSESVVPVEAAAARPAMAAVTEAAGVACRSASSVCRLVTGKRSKLAEAATRVAAAAASELVANLPAPAADSEEEAAAAAVVEGLEAMLRTTLATSSSSSSSSSSDSDDNNNYTTTTTTSDAARYLLDHLSRSLSAITCLGAAASSSSLQLALHPPPHLLLRSLRSASSSASSDASSLSRLLLYNLTSAASAIDQSISRLNSPSSSANLLLRESSTLLHHTIDNVAQQMVTLEAQLASIEGPLSEMLAAAEDRKNLHGRLIPGTNYRGSHMWASSGDRTTQISVTRGKLFYRINGGGAAGEDVDASSYGDVDDCVDDLNAGVYDTDADNDNSSASAVDGGNTGTEEPPPPPAWAWQIVAVEGGGDVFDGIADRYSAVLAYACSVDADAAPLVDLLLLSRTPTLDPATIHRLMDTAASYGIYTDDCQSPFLPTPQQNPDDDDDDCSNL